MIPENFEIDGIRYVTDEWGVVHQDPLEVTQKYDIEYVRQRYDSIPEIVHEMSFLRTGFLKGVIGKYQSILDIGYGNGDFLRTQLQWNHHEIVPFGTDISGYPVPNRCVFVDWPSLLGMSFDVACLFDSFEHLPDLCFLEWLNARMIVFTIPWLHPECGLDWFKGWKHRRPGEHLHHFTPESLTRMLKDFHYDLVACVDLEDGIRRVRNGHENTFTAIFRKC